MSIQPLEIVFECHVCTSTYIKEPTKYKCSKCKKKICDVCFVRHIITKRSCVFCRAPLIIEDVNQGTIIINIHSEPAHIVVIHETMALTNISEGEVCIRYPKTMWFSISFCCGWYIFLFVWMFYLAPR